MRQDIKKTDLYKNLLIKWNRKINLISDSTVEEVDEIHINDAIKGSQIIMEHFLAHFSNQREIKFYDLGSGNGIPGIIFSILYPEQNLVAVDSDQRKIAFLKAAKAEIKLSSFEPRCMRVGNIKNESKEESLIAVSRGFSSIAETLSMFEKTLFSGFYFFKSKDWEKELDEKCSTWNIKSIGAYFLIKKTGEKLSREIVFAETSAKQG